MHTLALIVFYFAYAASVICFLLAVGFGVYANAALLFAHDAIGTTRQGAVVVIDKSEIEINWEFPSVFAFVSIFWGLVAFALHTVK